jgi:hypothetical protein
MSRWIRLADDRGRDARVRLDSRRARPATVFSTADGRAVECATLIKSPLPRTFSFLRTVFGEGEELERALIEGDPEIDFEAAGRRTGPTDRILLDPDGKTLHAASEIEVILDDSGAEIERREPSDTLANIDSSTPLVWTGRMVRRGEAVRRFHFSRSHQIRHVDGLTFDFLFDLAERLEQADSLVGVGAGPRGQEPLVLERNGLPYRGFLGGRVAEKRYRLVLHLSRSELLPPEVNEE